MPRDTAPQPKITFTAENFRPQDLNNVLRQLFDYIGGDTIILRAEITDVSTPLAARIVLERDRDLAYQVLASGAQQTNLRVTVDGDVEPRRNIRLNNRDAADGAADQVWLYAVDESAGSAILGVQTESNSSITTGADITSNRRLAIDWNGTTYYLLASTTAT